MGFLRWLIAVLLPLKQLNLTKYEERLHELRISTFTVSDDRYDVAQSILSRIEQKSGTLLTHVSLMVALSGGLWAIDLNENALGSLDAWYFGLHLLLYLAIALLCIRCQRHVDAGDFRRVAGKVDESNSVVFSSREARLRRPKYDVAEILASGTRADSTVLQELREITERKFASEIALREPLLRFATAALYYLTIEFALGIAWVIVPWQTCIIWLEQWVPY